MIRILRAGLRTLAHPSSALGMALGITLAFHLPAGSLLADGLLLLSCFGFLCCTWRYWHAKLSGRLALLILLSVLGFSAFAHRHLDLIAGLLRYRSVVELMFGIALLQRLVGRMGLQHWIMRYGSVLSLRWRALAFGGFAALLALPLSMATVALFSTVLSSIAKPRLAGAKISMRAVSLTMLILPTTVASAAVSASLPGLDSARVAILGAPLFLVGLLSLIRTRLQLCAPPTAPVGPSRLMAYTLGFWGIFAAGLWAQLLIPECIALAGVLLYLIDCVSSQRSATDAMDEVGRALQMGSAEIFLLLACGIMASLIASQGPMSDIGQLAHASWSQPSLASAVLIFALPCIAALGVHPLFLFNLIFPAVDSSILGSLPLQYLSWSTMFLAAQLVSPVSISALLAASSLATSPTRTSYALHLKFVIFLCLLTYGYLNLLRHLGIG